MPEESTVVHDLLPHERDNTKESQILLWIWNCLGENSCFDFDQYVRDGVLFCRLMNYIKPNSVPGQIVSGGNLRQKRDNINKFLKAVQAYGVSKELLFEPDDLLLLRNLPKVTRCMFALGKKAEADSSFKGPYLGDEPYEAANKSGRRRGGLPVGDDIYIAHVKLENVIKQLHTPPKKIIDFYRPLIF
ncbi:muscle-specific protein 20-like [Uloborus diversus]|uniref:muscle-specific protein 20-like n=1 Tax=Uloborus diversus TaxID=327109 RepID=UPI002409BD9D|nr:muscle-specific protein 20-like [Uloborus diversus]